MSTEFTSSTYNPDRLLLDGPVPVEYYITLVSGQNLSRGAVLGKITSGGKYTLSLSASSDGSEVPDLILAEDCAASGGDKVTVAYATGHFDENEVTLGAGHTADSVREGLRDKGIHLIPSTTA